jgi:hypothetical protein
LAAVAEEDTNAAGAEGPRLFCILLFDQST